MAGHEKIKTELDFELFVGKLSEQILGDVYSLDTVYKTGGNHIEVTAVGYGYSFEVEIFRLARGIYKPFTSLFIINVGTFSLALKWLFV